MTGPETSVICAACYEQNAAGSSMCADCGGPLGMPFTEQHPVVEPHPVAGCSCGGEWDCTRCVMFLLDNNLPLDRAPSLTELQFAGLVAEGASR